MKAEYRYAEDDIFKAGTNPGEISGFIKAQNLQTNVKMSSFFMALQYASGS
jgi:hypothetical protein